MRLVDIFLGSAPILRARDVHRTTSIMNVVLIVSLGVPGLVFDLTKHDCLQLDHIKHFLFDE
jgi:hypothetical protein